MNKRGIYEAISALARRVEGLANGHQKAEVDETEAPPADLSELEKQVKRLSREAYRANAVAESQAEQTREALDALSGGKDAAIREARLELAEALLPVLDGIEAGLTSGAKQVRAMKDSTPEAARTLAAWLQGQQILRERLLKLLETEGITPIPAIGKPFDPYCHVVIGKVRHPDKPDGVIVKEERRGYQNGDKILRYAEVVVNQNPEGK
jgi:molecular chaperone GrpE